MTVDGIFTYLQIQTSYCTNMPLENESKFSIGLCRKFSMLNAFKNVKVEKNFAF